MSKASMNVLMNGHKKGVRRYNDSAHPLIYQYELILSSTSIYSNPGNLIRLNLPPSILMKTISFLLRPS